jgi:hypothetical protein
MTKRNWLVEDNLVALYIASYEYEDLNYELEEIERIVGLKAVQMRIDNYKYIATNGKSGLSAGGPSPRWELLYNIFKDFDQKNFAKLVNCILEVKSNMA